MARLVVIGGGAAGMSAASAARRVAPGLDVTVCEAGGFAAYGMCGIPYYLGGVVAEAENLLAYPPERVPRPPRHRPAAAHPGRRDRHRRAPGAPQPARAAAGRSATTG